MPNFGSKTVNVPLQEVVAVERCRMQVVDEIGEVRLALQALGADVPDEARLAFLNMVDGQLKRIEEKVEEGLGHLPEWLLRQS